MSDIQGNDTLLAEIGDAVKTMNAENGDKVGAGAQVGDGGADNSATAQESAFVVDDALIERSVKAGLSIADAKAFTSADQADRILKALEAKTANPTEEAAEQADEIGDGFPADKFDETLNAMKADGGYDQSFILLLEQLGSALKGQAKTISALKSAGASAEAKTSFEKSFSGLDSGVREHIDAATKSKLKSKFDFLKAAHKSTKDGATDEEVFDEARKLVLGEIESRYAEENKASAIEKRKSLAIARPGGESGQRGTDRPMTEEDIANALFRQLTK